MDIKQAFTDTLKTAKFGGISVHLHATETSELEVSVEAKGRINLPGDLDQVVANIGGMLGLGNSQAPSPSSSN